MLFARSDSNYKSLAGCDVWDAGRNALNWPGGCPIVAHPPCRAWGRLRTFAKPVPGEKDLARWAVCQVRRWGGVLEHPASSSLWRDQDLPMPAPGVFDDFGGWTLPVDQFWWGHKARKRTWLYIVGCRPVDLPVMPYRLGEASHVVASSIRKGSAGFRTELTPSEREHTPPELCRWLVHLARRCDVGIFGEVV